MEFMVPEVATKYKPVAEKDRIVHAFKTYSGKLSTIPIEVADQLFDAGNKDLLALRDAAAPGTVAAPAEVVVTTLVTPPEVVNTKVAEAVKVTPGFSTSCKSVGQ